MGTTSLIRQRAIDLIKELPEEQVKAAYEMLLKLRNTELSLDEYILLNTERVIKENRSLLLRLARYDSGKE